VGAVLGTGSPFWDHEPEGLTTGRPDHAVTVRAGSANPSAGMVSKS